MTAPQTPGREQEIRARAEAATRCPEAVVNGRLDGEHTWVGGSFTSVRCELCGFSRTRGERAEDTMELLAEIDRLRVDRDAAVAAAVRRALEDFASRLTARATSMGAEYFRVDQVVEAARKVAAEEHGPAVAAPAREQGETDPSRCLSQHPYSPRDGFRMICGSCDHGQNHACHTPEATR